MAQKPNIPPVVTVVRASGVRLGKCFTVARDPQAKKDVANNPSNNPHPNRKLPNSAFVATNPPARTSATAPRNLFVNCLLSNMTSKTTAKTGMVAAARAALTALVRYCVTSKSNDPIPKPMAPTQNPCIQGRRSKLFMPCARAKSPSNKANAKPFLIMIREMMPQVSNSFSAAGNPNANIPTAAMHCKLPDRPGDQCFCFSCVTV